MKDDAIRGRIPAGDAGRPALALILVFVILAAGIVTAGYLYFRNYEINYRVEVGRQLSAIADLKVSELVQYRTERLGDASILFRNTSFSAIVRRVLANPADGEAHGQLREWLGKFQSHNQYDQICLLDARGATRMAIPAARPPVSSVILLRVPEILRSGGVTFQDFYRNEHDRRPYLAVLVPVHGGKDEPRAMAVLLLRIDPETYLYPFLRRWPTPSRTAETLLLRRDGNEVLYLNELKFRKNTALALRVPLDDKSEMPAVKAVLGREGIVEGVDYRGVPVLADVRAVPSSPWFLVSRMDRSEVNAPVRERLWWLVVLVSVLLLGAAAGVGVVWRQQRVRFYREGYEATERVRESEKRYRLLAENATDVIWTIDLDGRFTYISPSVVQLLGFTPDEIVGQPLEEIVSPGSVPIARERMQRNIEAAGRGVRLPPEILEVEHFHKDRSSIWTEAVARLIFDEDGKPTFFLGVTRDITGRRRAEEALRESERMFRRLTRQFHALLDAIPDNITRQSPDLRVIWANRAAAEGLKKEATELVGGYCYTLWHNKTSPCGVCPVLETFRTGEPALEVVTTPDGKTLELRTVPVKEAGRVVEVVEIGRDITENRKLEGQFRQAQKMEAVGRLAGGVAHDFNNMLNVILGYADMALARVDPGAPLAQDLQEIMKAGQRSADLTRQLLAFSRKQIVAPLVLNLNKEIEEQLKMLGRLIGEDVRIDFLPAGDLWNTRIDPSQVSQILANLSVNARDAIAGVGTVTIETANVAVDEAYCREHHYVAPGEYVMVSFSDTGAGMDAATRERIFEPFFTTKGEGKGTGLGMSTVYGIVKQNGGFVQVYSEPDQGTTVRVYFPGVKDSTEDPVVKVAEGSLAGTETVLIVEDEEQILTLSRRILEQYGYRVLTARTPGDACRLVEEQEGDIHLLLTDVILPETNGKELKRRIEAVRPGIKTLFMSGYTANAIARRGILEKNVNFIQKPFSLMSLAKKVRQVLDSQKS